MKRISEEENRKRLELYHQGLTDREIADKLFYSPGAIAQWRWKLNLPPHNNPVKKLTKEQHEKRMKLYNLGYGDKRIAKICKVTKSAIAQWRYKNGLKSNMKKGQHENE